MLVAVAAIAVVVSPRAMAVETVLVAWCRVEALDASGALRPTGDAGVVGAAVPLLIVVEFSGL